MHIVHSLIGQYFRTGQSAIKIGNGAGLTNRLTLDSWGQMANGVLVSFGAEHDWTVAAASRDNFGISLGNTVHPLKSQYKSRLVTIDYPALDPLPSSTNPAKMSAPLAKLEHPDMIYRFLGDSGLKISVLSLGGWLTHGGHTGDEIALETIKTAYDGGINFFDSAEGYAGGRAEILLGKAVRQFGWDREDVVISTKIYFGEHEDGSKGINGACVPSGLKLDMVLSLYCRSWTIAEARARRNEEVIKALTDGLRGSRL